MPSKQQINVGLKFNADVSEAQRALEQLKATLENITSGKSLTGFSLTTELNKAVSDASRLQAILKNTTMQNGNLDLGAFRQELNRTGLSIENLAGSLLSLGAEGNQAFMQLTQSIINAEIPLRTTSTLVSKLALTLKNVATWQISSSILHGFMSSVSSAYGYAQDLNESLNNIRIVSKQNTDQMADFAKEANKAAKELSITTTAYTDAALIFYQQGLKGADVTERTDVVAKMSNVTRDSVDEVSSYMTAIWNNFDDGSESLEHYADVITGLGAATASSSAEIAAGLEKFAAVADTVGLSYDYATASLATVVAQTRQSADTVGTAFKTLFARIEGLKLGKTLDDGVDLNKYSQALATIGVNILDANGQLRNMDNILDDLGAKWKNIDKATQVAVAQTVAGTRQYNQLVALLDNWDKVQENIGVARSSDGELQSQADIYAESWEAAQKRVRAAWESIYSSLFDDKVFINLTNNLGKFIEGIDTVIKALGGLKGLLPILSVGLLNLFSKDLSKGINNFIYNLQTGTNTFQNKLASFKEEISTYFQDIDIKNITDDATNAAMRNQATYLQAMLEKKKQLVAEGREQTEIEKTIEQLHLNRINTLNEELILQGKKADALAKEQSSEGRNFQNALNGVKQQVLPQNENQFTDPNTGTVTVANPVTKERVDNFNELATALGRVNAIYEEYTEKENALGLTQGAEAFSKMYENLELIDKGFKEGIQEEEDFKNALEALTKAALENNEVEVERQKNILESIQSSLSDKVRTETDEILNNTDVTEENVNVIKNHTEAVKKAQQGFNKYADALANANAGTREAINSASKQTLTVPDFGASFTNATRSVVSFGSALRSLNSIFDILSNTEMSFGEKFISILTSGGMAISMMVSSFKGFSQLFTPILKNAEILTSYHVIDAMHLDKQLASKTAIKAIDTGILQKEEAKEILTAIQARQQEAIAGKYQKQLTLMALQEGIENGRIGIVTALLTLSKLETTEKEKQLIIDQIREKLQGKLNPKNLFAPITKGIGSLKEIIVGLGALGGAIVVVTAAIAAAVIIYKGWKTHLKGIAEESKNIAQQENEKLQKIKEEVDAIDSLTDKYAELKAQLSEIGSEKAKAEMFNMAVEAGKTELAIKALASSFESYGNILQEVEKEENEAYKKQAEITKTAAENAAFADFRANLKERYTDNSGNTIDIGKGAITGSDNLNFNKALESRFGLMVDSSGHIKTDDFIKVLETNQDEFVKFINSSNSKNAKNLQEIYGQIKDSAEMLKEAGSAYADSVERTVVASQKQNIAEIKTLQQYEKVKQDLKKSAESEGYFDVANLKTFEEQDKWARDLIIQQGTLNELLAEQLLIQDSILEKQRNFSNSKDGYETKTLAGNVHNGFKYTEEEVQDLVSGIEQIIQETSGLSWTELSDILTQGNYKELNNEVQKSVDEALRIIASYKPDKAIVQIPVEVQLDNKSEEEYKKDLQKTIDQLSKEQLNYVTLNIDRFSSVEELNKVLNGDFKKRIEAFNQKEAIVSISSSINNLDLSKKKNTGFEAEDINSFFEYTDQINGLNQESFGNLEASSQLYNIIQGVDELSEDYAAHMREAKEEAQKDLKILEQQRDTLLESTGYQELLEHVNTANNNGAQTDIAETASFLMEYNEALNGSQEDLKAFTAEHAEFLKQLGLENNVDSLLISRMATIGAHYLDNTDKIAHTTEEIASYNEELDAQIDKVKAAQQMYLAVNKEMDNLQSAYKAIKSAQEEWSKEGYLTMDTVQSLISVDNAYMSTLEVTANGIKMNEQAYVDVTKAKYASMAASIALEAQELVNKLVNEEITVSDFEKAAAIYQTAEASFSAADAALAEARATLASKAANEEYVASVETYLNAVEKKVNILKQGANQVNIGNIGSVLDTSKNKNSKKDKDTKDLKEYADEFDRFYPYQKVIDDVADAMSDLAKAQDHMAGGELVGALRKQNKLLEQQKKAYQDLAKEQKTYQKEMQADLAKYGMSFNIASGNIVNYAEVTQAMLDQYNAAVKKYNKSSKEDADEKTLKVAEKEYEKFKKLVSNYQNILTEIQDTENSLDDIYYEQIANNLKEFEVMVQVKLDISEARRDVADFINKINKNFKTLKKSTEDWMSIFDNALEKAHTYVNGDLGTINVDLEALNKVKEAINSGDYGNANSMFASETEAVEKYKELSEQLRDDAEDLYELYTDAWSEYLDAVDEAIERWEELISSFDSINDTLEHQEKILKLLYGEDSERTLNALKDIYQKQEVVSLEKQNALRQSLITLQEQYDKALADAGGNKNNEDVKKIKEAIDSNAKELETTIEDYIDIIKKELENATTIADNARQKAIWGNDLDKIREDWEKAKKFSEGYLDSVQKVYELDKLNDGYSKLINDTKSVKLKKQLAEFAKLELDALTKQEKISEHDIELANQRLEVERARIALEEAQNNKSSMRLRRDSQGNWSYQFIADEDNIEEKMQAIEDKASQGRDKALEFYNETVEKMMDLEEEFSERTLELARLAAEGKIDFETEYKKLCEEYYGENGYITQLSKDAERYKQQANRFTTDLLFSLYKEDRDNYDRMTSDEKALIDSLKEKNIDSYSDILKYNIDTYGKIDEEANNVNQNEVAYWKTMAANAIKNMSDIERHTNACYESIQSALDDYDQHVQDSEAASGIAWSNVEEQVAAVEERILEVIDMIDECVDASEQLDDFRERVNEIERAWRQVEESIRDAMRELDSYLQKLLEIKEEQEAVNRAMTEATQADLSGIKGSGGNSSGSTGGGNTGGKSGSTSSTSKWGIYEWDSANHTQILIAGGYDTKMAAQSAMQVYKHRNPEREYKVAVDFGGQQEHSVGYDRYTNNNSTTTNNKTSSQKSTYYSPPYKTVKMSNNGENYSEDELDFLYKWQNYVPTFSSGGYTGTWNSIQPINGSLIDDGNNGRLAWLHQKELVLNQSDTKNILDAVDMVRQLTLDNNAGFGREISETIVKATNDMAAALQNGIDYISNSIMDSVYHITDAMMLNAERKNVLEQDVHIDASFPNVVDRYEIESAFNNLVNIASQRANRSRNVILKK